MRFGANFAVFFLQVAGSLAVRKDIYQVHLVDGLFSYYFDFVDY